MKCHYLILKLIWSFSEDCAIFSATGETKLSITDTKPYVPVVLSSTEDNVKLLKRLESGFKRAINWNKYQLKLTQQAQNRYLDYLIDASFHGVNGFFGWSFQNWYLPKMEIKDYNAIINEKKFFGQPVKNDLMAHNKIWKIETGDDCTTGCLLDYLYFKKHYELIATDLSKQQNLMLIQKQCQNLLNLTGN